jgi:hypothetical protein
MNHEDTPLFLEPGEAEPYWWLDWHAPRADHKANMFSGNVVSGTVCATNMCGETSGYMDLPFCEDCAWKMWSVMDAECPEYMKDAARKGRLDHARRQEASRAAHEAQREIEERARPKTKHYYGGWIYYLKVGDLIKIGYTMDLGQRLKAYPPNTELLAKHPGTTQTEKDMHNKFLVHLAKGREWFKPSDEVMEHIEAVKVKYPTLSKKEERERFWSINRAEARPYKPMPRPRMRKV